MSRENKKTRNLFAHQKEMRDDADSAAASSLASPRAEAEESVKATPVGVGRSTSVRPAGPVPAAVVLPLLRSAIASDANALELGTSIFILVPQIVEFGGIPADIEADSFYVYNLATAMYLRTGASTHIEVQLRGEAPVEVLMTTVHFCESTEASLFRLRQPDVPEPPTDSNELDIAEVGALDLYASVRLVSVASGAEVCWLHSFADIGDRPIAGEPAGANTHLVSFRLGGQQTPPHQTFQRFAIERVGNLWGADVFSARMCADLMLAYMEDFALIRLAKSVRCFIYRQLSKRPRLQACLQLLQRTDRLKRMLRYLNSFITVGGLRHTVSSMQNPAAASVQDTMTTISRRTSLLQMMKMGRLLLLLLKKIMHSVDISDHAQIEERDVCLLCFQLLEKMGRDSPSVLAEMNAQDLMFLLEQLQHDCGSEQFFRQVRVLLIALTHEAMQPNASRQRTTQHMLAVVSRDAGHRFGAIPPTGAEPLAIVAHKVHNAPHRLHLLHDSCGAEDCGVQVPEPAVDPVHRPSERTHPDTAALYWAEANP